MSIKTRYAIDQAGDTDISFTQGSISPLGSVGPSCVHFFPANEATGTDLDDIVGGVQVTATNAWDGNFQGPESPATSEALGAGTWNDFTSSDFAFFILGKYTAPVAGGIGAGNITAGTGQRFSVTVGTFFSNVLNATIIDGSDVIINSGNTTMTVSSGDVYGVGCTVDRDGNADFWFYKGSGTAETKSVSVGSFSTSAFQPAAQWYNTEKCGGLAMWEFANGLPTDVTFSDVWAQMYSDWSTASNAKKILPAALITK